jgi:hypothetical protein
MRRVRGDSTQSGRAAFAPLPQGMPPSLAPIDREMNGLIAPLVAALKPS